MPSLKNGIKTRCKICKGKIIIYPVTKKELTKIKKGGYICGWCIYDKKI